MKWLFWTSLCTLLYTYLGYPCGLYLRARMRPQPVCKGPYAGAYSIVIAAHNEVANIGRKLDNLAALGLPTSRREVIVVSDGSTDGTNQILAARACPGLSVLFQEPRAGKAVALNLGIKEASGDVLVFMDARQTIEPGAIENLLANFADPSVGCVSGALMIGQQNLAGTVHGETVKMAFENKIRSWEGQSGSMIGAAGAFYAVRRELMPEIPAGTLLDDMYVPLHALKAGVRVVLEDKARAWDDLTPTFSQEFRRKVRTLLALRLVGLDRGCVGRAVRAVPGRAGRDRPWIT